MNVPLTTFPVCKDCGYSHPPIEQGKKCPMSKEKTPTGKEINFEEIFVPLKNILLSQINKKNIKDVKKLFGKIIIDVTKISEEYTENEIIKK